MMLRPGERLEVAARDDRIEISRPVRSDRLVPNENGLLSLRRGDGPGLDADQVREVLERIRG